jgi:hypothetical protein
MDKTAFVDIDNTLWQFCDVLYEDLRKINRDFPAIEHWTGWDIWQGYCSEEDFYGAVNAIHRRQDSDAFRPYPEAQGFLSALRQHGFRIIIASHRSPEFMAQTERWLKKHDLAYDDLHLSYQKTDLITSETTVVVDDSPHVLEKALEHGVLATGLLFPWNRAYAGNGFRLYGNLSEMLEIILQRDR